MIAFVHSLDQSIVLMMSAARTDLWTNFFIWVSEFGRPYTIGALTAAIILYFYLIRRFDYATGLLASVAGAGALVILIKSLTAIARPDITFAAYPEVGYSFPSWHAAGSIAFYGFLIFLAAQQRHMSRVVRTGIFSGLPALIILVAYSRVYLGVHYLSDVLGGAVVGLLCLTIGIIVTKRKIL